MRDGRGCLARAPGRSRGLDEKGAPGAPGSRQMEVEVVRVGKEGFQGKEVGREGGKGRGREDMGWTRGKT